MSTYVMLDTNMVSHVIRQNGNALKNFLAVNPQNLCLSTVCYGEIIFGLEKRPHATGLNQLMRAFLMPLDILPWTREVAETYGRLRSRLEKHGTSIGSMDLLIASHALHLDATLATADKAFTMIDGLKQENWIV